MAFVGATTPLLQQEKRVFPGLQPSRPTRRSSTTGRRIPQTIAHRGFKARCPENTLRAFHEAIAAGTHALETDIHLSRDGVVVLSHDPSLERCFGVKKKVIDCDWGYLRTLRTVAEPHEPMPRLIDLLEYLSQPGLQDIWVLLDIKLDNDASAVISAIAAAIASAPVSSSPAQRPWHERIVLGCWSAQYLPLCAKHLPDFPITLICFDLHYARQFFSVPNVSFNVNLMALMGVGGRRFLRDARANHRVVYVWTVNAPNLMRWSIRHGVDGVITDDPALFRQISEEYDHGNTAGLEPGRHERRAAPATADDRATVKQRAQALFLSTLLVLFGWMFRRRFLQPVDAVWVKQFSNSNVGVGAHPERGSGSGSRQLDERLIDLE